MDSSALNRSWDHNGHRAVYRLSAVLVFAIWAYFFAVESTRSYWQSHYYLELLTCFLIMWMPAARRFSVDAWRKNLPRDVPFWTIFLLRGQLVIAYFYAGVAKFHLDWFLDAVPVRWFLSDPNVTTPYEPYLTDSQLEALQNVLHSPELAYFWGGFRRRRWLSAVVSTHANLRARLDAHLPHHKPHVHLR